MRIISTSAYKWNVRKCIPYVATEPPDFAVDMDDNTLNTARLAQFDHLAQSSADDAPLQQQATVAPTPPATPPWAESDVACAIVISVSRAFRPDSVLLERE